MGKTTTLEDCERACRTTATDGTSPRKMKTGAEKMGFSVLAEFREARDAVAALLLNHWISHGSAVLITVDAGSHWVAVIGRLGPQYLIADSGDNELVLGYSEGELLQRWRDSESSKPYHGLVIS